jgi:hypothetical protein
MRDSDQLIMDTDRLSESYVVDAHFVENNNLPQLNRDISRALPQRINFELLHLSGAYYLLAFNSNITHQQNPSKKRSASRYGWS